MQNYYEILGVSENATPDEIKKAYRKLARKHHPDVSKTDNDERFKQINEAYEVLKDEEKKSRYDFQRKMGTESHPFVDLFGSMRFNQRQSPAENITIRINIPVTLEEIFGGVKKKAKYSRRTVCSECKGKKSSEPENKIVCPHCGGAGRLGSRRGIMTIMTACPYCSATGYRYSNPCKTCGASGSEDSPHEVIIDIPAGGFTQNSQRFMKGHGHESLITPGKFGQLVVDVEVTPHKDYQLTRNGDIISSVPLPLWIAICGGTISVATLHGPRDIEIKSGTQERDCHTISGAGFWKPSRNGYANHTVVFQIEIPKNLTEEDKGKIRELSKGADNYPDYFASLAKAKKAY